MSTSAADYIIVGGGTAGLVLANRLSEDPNVSVLVIESGLDRTYEDKVQDPDRWQSVIGTDYAWQYESVPQPDLGSRVLKHPQGRVLGGSSTINAGWFVAPSQAIIDSWATLGNFKWTYNDLLSYLKKSYTLQAPDASKCAALGLLAVDDINKSAHGPIKVNEPNIGYQNPILKAWNTTFQRLGYHCTANLFDDHASIGGYGASASVDATGRRSGAALEYGVPASKRSNVKILTGATAEKIDFAGTAPNLTATGIKAVREDQTITITANKELILSAGTFGSPKLLELSGIGNPSILKDLSIPVLYPNVSVGENLQNHAMVAFTVEMRVGAIANNGIKALNFMPLQLCKGLEDRANRKTFFDQFSPLSERDKMHYDLIRGILDSQEQATCSMMMGPTGNPGLAVMVLIITTPFSRGHSHISSTSAFQLPQIDPRYFSHPADIEIMAHNLITLVGLCNGPDLQQFIQPVSGQANVKNVESAKEFIRNNMAPALHPCGTSAMLPRDKGSVIDEDLIVYGTRNVRVVDASVFPVIPNTNPVATVYAVAERAADLIKGWMTV